MIICFPVPGREESERRYSFDVVLRIKTVACQNFFSQKASNVPQHTPIRSRPETISPSVKTTLLDENLSAPARPIPMLSHSRTSPELETKIKPGSLEVPKGTKEAYGSVS